MIGLIYHFSQCQLLLGVHHSLLCGSDLNGTLKSKLEEMKRIHLLSALLVALMCVGFTTDASAQRGKKKKKKDTEAPAAPKKKKGDAKDIDEVIKGCTAYEGLLNIYQDTLSGKLYLEVTAEDMDKEFIYFSHVENGLVEAGFFRGAYRGQKIISFDRYYDKIQVSQANTNFYFDDETALSKAAEANINEPLLLSESIYASNDDETRFLIDGNSVFLGESFQMVKPPSNPQFPSLLGQLSKSKSRVEAINNYPENSEVRVTYVYDNKNPRRGGSEAVGDVRNISVTYQHSILSMPDDGYEPRRDDPRVGYFMTQVNDMTSFSATPYRDMIHRWRLEKQNPGAAVSDPVEPITYWIENTTPEEFRPIIKAGVERWNDAFEKAGFSNAVVVKIQPDDAEWDAGDIRYNVLRWTSSPQPPFGGYGPSFVNPRTGEILGADIMLEFAALRGRLFKTEVFGLAGYTSEAEMEQTPFSDDPHFCAAGEHMHHNLLFGLHSMRAMDMEKAAKEEFIRQTLYRLVLHEVGHTLGLSHNMRASTLQSVEDIKNKEKIEREGLCNSVMEYPSINYALNPEEQTLYYDDKPGFYDNWVINYGYSEALADPAAEEARLQKILARSNDPKLAFGNDADDMRSAGRGFDPDVNIYDLSSDPVAYGVERIQLVNQLLPKIVETYTLDGQSNQELLNAFYVLTGEHITQVRIMTRQIGGVHYDRSYPEQNSETRPFEPVSEEKQKAAMDALATYAFAPDAWDAADGVYNYLLAQRRGFDHFISSQDPKITNRVMAAHGECMRHLLHPNVLKRIVDSELYGNTYTLDKYMTDLTDAVFKADLRKGVNSFRQNLQVMYVQALIDFDGEKSRQGIPARSMANYELARVEKMMKSASSPNTMTKAHRQYILQLIDEAKNS